MILRLSFGTPSTGTRMEEGGLPVGGLGTRRGCCSCSWREDPSFVSLATRSSGGATSNLGGDELRTQLDQLQAEADATTAKANSARLRLARLSEVCEQLQRRAALYVEAGKEDDARGLLSMKKKIMFALDKSKNRIEVFDKLSTKLCQAISLKGSQLSASDDGFMADGSISSYNAFLEHEDRLLKQIEDDFLTVLRFSYLFRDQKEEEVEDTKLKQISEIREDIANIRERIANIIAIDPSMIGC